MAACKFVVGLRVKRFDCRAACPEPDMLCHYVIVFAAYTLHRIHRVAHHADPLHRHRLVTEGRNKTYATYAKLLRTLAAKRSPQLANAMPPNFSSAPVKIPRSKARGGLHPVWLRWGFAHQQVPPCRALVQSSTRLDFDFWVPKR